MELFELRRITCIRRMRWSNWEFAPPRELPLVMGGRSRLSRGTVSRNIDVALHLWLRFRLSALTDDMAPITSNDGAII